jgi:O-antigen/teichoic acid export membrane protein
MVKLSKAVTYTVATYLTSFVSVLSSVIIARSLGVEAFGFFQIINAVLATLALFVSPNFEEVIIKALSRKEALPLTFLFVFELLFRTFLALTFLGNYQAITSLFALPHDVLCPSVVFVAIFLVPPVSVIEGYLRARHREWLQNLMKLSASVLCLLAFVVAHFFYELTLQMAVLMALATKMLERAFQVVLVLKIKTSGFDWRPGETSSTLIVIKEAMWAGMGQMASFPIKSVTLVAALFFPASIVGLVKLADNLALMAYQAATATYQLQLPAIISSFGKDNVVKPTYVYLAVTSIGVMTGISLYVIVPIAYGDDFVPAISYFWILLGGYIAASTIYKAPGNALASNSLKNIFYVRLTVSGLFMFCVYLFGAENAFVYVAVVSFFKYLLMVVFTQQSKWAAR